MRTSEILRLRGLETNPFIFPKLAVSAAPAQVFPLAKQRFFGAPLQRRHFSTIALHSRCISTQFRAQTLNSYSEKKKKKKKGSTNR